MKAIEGFENIKEAGGDIETLPAGGYICRIEACEEKPNRNGGTHLEIMFDIAEGEYKGFFTADWKAQNREDKYWHGILRQNIPNENSPKYDMQCGFFKRFINNIEASNEGYHWDWNEKGLAKKIIGIVFGEVERMSSKGTKYVTTRADSVVSVDAIKEGKFKIPARRTMPDPAPVDIVLTDMDGEDKSLPF